MIDLVYPIKLGGSKIDDAELRYSLRGVYMHSGLKLGRLFIFGALPAWLQGAVHVPMTDKGDKANNLREKYRRMCQTAELSDPFLLLDDDHMMLKPMGGEFPLYTRGPLAALVKEYRGQNHGTYLKAAYTRLVIEQLDTRNYQIHFPMLISKAILRGAVAMMNRPMVMGSIYGNIVGDGVEIERDFRANTDADLDALRNGRFMSLPPIVRPELQKLLSATLTEPSPWELAPGQVRAEPPALVTA